MSPHSNHGRNPRSTHLSRRRTFPCPAGHVRRTRPPPRGTPPLARAAAPHPRRRSPLRPVAGPPSPAHGPERRAAARLVLLPHAASLRHRRLAPPSPEFARLPQPLAASPRCSPPHRGDRRPAALAAPATAALLLTGRSSSSHRPTRAAALARRRRHASAARCRRVSLPPFVSPAAAAGELRRSEARRRPPRSDPSRDGSDPPARPSKHRAWTAPSPSPSSRVDFREVYFFLLSPRSAYFLAIFIMS